MSFVNITLLLTGIGLIALGYARGRVPYARMRELEATADNLRRYETWRGGRGEPEGGPSGADLMREQLRRQVRRWATVALLGFILVFFGFFIR
jgi:hypothetical protein